MRALTVSRLPASEAIRSVVRRARLPLDLFLGACWLAAALFLAHGWLAPLASRVDVMRIAIAGLLFNLLLGALIGWLLEGKPFPTGIATRVHKALTTIGRPSVSVIAFSILAAAWFWKPMPAQVDLETAVITPNICGQQLFGLRPWSGSFYSGWSVLFHESCEVAGLPKCNYEEPFSREKDARYFKVTLYGGLGPFPGTAGAPLRSIKLQVKDVRDSRLTWEFAHVAYSRNLTPAMPLGETNEEWKRADAYAFDALSGSEAVVLFTLQYPTDFDGTAKDSRRPKAPSTDGVTVRVNINGTEVHRWDASKRRVETGT